MPIGTDGFELKRSPWSLHSWREGYWRRTGDLRGSVNGPAGKSSCTGQLRRPQMRSVSTDWVERPSSLPAVGAPSPRRGTQ